MVVHWIADHEDALPDPALAEPSGLLAVGGDLSPERLLNAYSHGIFPWYEEGLPILWHSPDPRMVLRSQDLHVSRSLRKRIRQDCFEIRMNTNFSAVIRSCAQQIRSGQAGTWITEDMIRGYCSLHKRGHAHSIEAWQGTELVGGLYGVSIGRIFCGESMFATVPDASKVAFVWAVCQLERWGIDLLDCQVHTEHLENFGAKLWPRAQFLDELRKRVTLAPKNNSWCFEATLDARTVAETNRTRSPSGANDDDSEYG